MNAQQLTACEALAEYGTYRAAAAELGIPASTFQMRVQRERAALKRDDESEFDQPTMPIEEPPIGDLIDSRAAAFERKKRAFDARMLIPIKVRLDGPIGILHMGDPHVDDDGCDWSTLQHHVKLAQTTPGLLAGNVGDYTNNWIGRLARLYGQQGTTAKDGWRLAEWLVGSVPWLYLIGGNHDFWLGDGDPVKWMARQAGVNYEMHGTRLQLSLPNGRKLRINGRHDFLGHSQWNPAHGPSKAAQMGPDDHIYVCGHRHVFGMGVFKKPSGIWTTALRVGTYKHFDSYAAEKGFSDHNLPAVVTLIFPEATEEGFVETFKDVDLAADFLTWARSRHASGKSVKRGTVH